MAVGQAARSRLLAGKLLSHGVNHSLPARATHGHAAACVATDGESSSWQCGELMQGMHVHAPDLPWPSPAVGALWRRLGVGAYALPCALVYGLFVLWPLARIVWLSGERWDGYGAAVPVGLANYGSLVDDPGFGTELWHSTVWLVVTLAFPMLTGLGLALLIAQAPARIAGACRVLILLPLLLPSVVIAVIWKLMYTPLDGCLNDLLQALGLGAWTQDWLGDPDLALDSLLAAACWASFGLSLLVFGAALASLSRDLREAAALDGAGVWTRFRHLTLPQLRHALPLATVATALCAVPSFDLVSLLTNGGPGYATTTLELDMEGRAFGLGQVGVGAALACVSALSGLILSLIAMGIAHGYEQAGEEVAASWQSDRQGKGRGRRRAAAGLLVATMLLLLPIVWLLQRAGHMDWGETGPWANVVTVWSEGLGAAFGTSVLIAFVVAAAAVSLALLAAFALHQARSRAVQAAGIAALAIGLFQPVEVLIIPLFNLLQDLGLLNTTAGVILPEIGRALPLAALLLWAALRAVPRSILEAAAVDGAAPWHVLWRVAAPLVAPMIVVTAVWSFLSSWNEYLLPTVVLQDDSVETVPIALGHFIGRIDTQYALIATGALLAAAPLVVAYMLGYNALSAGVRRLRTHAY